MLSSTRTLLDLRANKVVLRGRFDVGLAGFLIGRKLTGGGGRHAGSDGGGSDTVFGPAGLPIDTPMQEHATFVTEV